MCRDMTHARRTLVRNGRSTGETDEKHRVRCPPMGLRYRVSMVPWCGILLLAPAFHAFGLTVM